MRYRTHSLSVPNYSLFKSIVTEKQGVLNQYNHNELKNNNDVIDKIYRYVIKTIISNLNNKKETCNFVIPKRLYNKADDLKGVTNIYINYNGDLGIDEKMSVNYDSLTYNNIIFDINIGLFDNEFKPTFMHECQHLLQIATTKIGFAKPNIDKLISIFFDKGITRTEYIALMHFVDIIYFLNPQEVNAFKEQVYKESYYYSSNNLNTLSSNEIYKHLMNKVENDYLSKSKYALNIGNTSYSRLMYIWVLLVMNHSDFIDPERLMVHVYRLFYKEIYYNTLIDETVKKLKNKNEEQIYEILKQEFPKFLNDKELVEDAISCIEVSINEYKKDAISTLSKAIKLGISDAIDSNNSELMYDYTYKLDNENKKIFVYLICNEGYTNTNTYITKLKGNNINEIFKYMLILETYFIKNKININLNLGYIILNKRYQKYKKQNILNFSNIQISLPKIQYLTDIDKVIQYIQTNY